MFIEVRITSPVWLCLRTVFCISTCVLLVNISLPVEPQRNMSTCMRQKTSLSRHILCWSSTCVFIIFHRDPNMWPSCWRGRANRKDIVKTYNIKTAEGHNGFASQQFSLPFFFSFYFFYSCQVRPWGLDTVTCMKNRSSLWTINDLFKDV